MGQAEHDLLILYDGSEISRLLRQLCIVQKIKGFINSRVVGNLLRGDIERLTDLAFVKRNEMECQKTVLVTDVTRDLLTGMCY